MSTNTVPKRYKFTERDLEELDARGYRFELIKGELDPMSPTSFGHGDVSNQFAAYVSVYVSENNLGRCTIADAGYVVSHNPDTILAPDFAFVRNAKLSDIDPIRYAHVVPDLVLETRSPNTPKRKALSKIELWLHAGVQVAIDIDPKNRSLMIHRPDREPVTLGPSDTFRADDILPGFDLPLAKVFRDRASHVND